MHQGLQHGLHQGLHQGWLHQGLQHLPLLCSLAGPVADRRVVHSQRAPTAEMKYVQTPCGPVDPLLIFPRNSSPTPTSTSRVGGRLLFVLVSGLQAAPRRSAAALLGQPALRSPSPAACAARLTYIPGATARHATGLLTMWHVHRAPRRGAPEARGGRSPCRSQGRRGDSLGGVRVPWGGEGSGRCFERDVVLLGGGRLAACAAWPRPGLVRCTAAPHHMRGSTWWPCRGLLWQPR